MNNINNTLPSTSSKEPPIPNVREPTKTVVASSSKNHNGTFETTTETEPSNREILNMLQTIKVDVDHIKSLVQGSSVTATTNDNTLSNLEESCGNVEPSASELIRITERWDEANPKAFPPSDGLQESKIRGTHANATTNDTQSTRTAIVATSPSPTKKSRAIVVATSPLPTKSRATVASPSTPKVSNVQMAGSPLNTDTGLPAIRAKLLSQRYAQLHGAGQSEQSGATLVAKRFQVNFQPMTAMDGPLYLTNEVLSNASDQGLMLLSERVREERRRRLDEVIAADCEDRFRVLSLMDGNTLHGNQKMRRRRR